MMQVRGCGWLLGIALFSVCAVLNWVIPCAVPPRLGVYILCAIVVVVGSVVCCYGVSRYYYYSKSKEEEENNKQQPDEEGKKIVNNEERKDLEAAVPLMVIVAILVCVGIVFSMSWVVSYGRCERLSWEPMTNITLDEFLAGGQRKGYYEFSEGIVLWDKGMKVEGSSYSSLWGTYSFIAPIVSTKENPGDRDDYPFGPIKAWAYIGAWLSHDVPPAWKNPDRHHAICCAPSVPLSEEQMKRYEREGSVDSLPFLYWEPWQSDQSFALTWIAFNALMGIPALFICVLLLLRVFHMKQRGQYGESKSSDGTFSKRITQPMRA